MATATVAILSPGEMGAGIARLLRAYNFRIITSNSGRRPSATAYDSYTTDRAAACQIEFVSSDVDLINQADIILSVVPPSESLPTARRVGYAYTYVARGNKPPLYFIDLNATSPGLAERIEEVFARPGIGGTGVRFVDGAILGGPPEYVQTAENPGGAWRKPRIVVSGPERLVGEAGQRLEEALGLKWVGDRVGQASGLKMCFASLTKGLNGLAIQSFTTAANLSLLPELKEEISAYFPPLLDFLERSVPATPPKAYRCVREMEEIADTHSQTGFSRAVFSGIAEVYRGVAQDDELGKERFDRRNRGTTVEDFAECIREGLSRKEEENNRANAAAAAGWVQQPPGRAVERMLVD
ncbi:6-phosphogluconate dehydrogenase [Morchella snyderi]|nr:6-phosphogluconate dehydrogenase [Morchella snyderi]